MSTVIELLRHLGFTEYEARAYVTLVERGPLSGYELAKVSAIPRPNIYAVLQKLEERAAVVHSEAPAGIRYAAVPPRQVLARLSLRYQTTITTAQATLDLLQPPQDHTTIWNVAGYTPILEHAQSLIETAQNEVLLVVYQAEADALSAVIGDAAQRGINIVTLCLQACQQSCVHCRGLIARYRLLPTAQPRWLLIVQDMSELLSGEIVSASQAHGIRTRQQMVVDLVAWYVRHGIAVGAVVTDLGDHLEELVSPTTRTILTELALVDQPGGWLTYMRQLLQSTSDQP